MMNRPGLHKLFQRFSPLKFHETSKQPLNMNIKMHSYFKSDTIFAIEHYIVSITHNKRVHEHQLKFEIHKRDTSEAIFVSLTL